MTTDRQKKADDRLRAELDRLIEPARPIFQFRSLQDTLGIWLAQPSPSFEDISSDLQEACDRHPSVIGFKRSCFGEKQFTMGFGNLGTSSLMQVALDRGSNAAVEWLNKIASLDQADLLFVLVVHGLRVEKRIELSNGVALLPWDQLPKSGNSRAVAANHQLRPHSMGEFWPPVAAVIEIKNVPARNHYGEPSGCSDADGAVERLRKTVRMFALHSDFAPVGTISWVDFVDEDLKRAEFARMWQGGQTDVSTSHLRASLVTSETIDWVERLLSAGTVVQAHCDIALDRLAMARTRSSPGNKAIDGAICLEAVISGGGAGELIHKLSVRTAILLGGSLAERRAVRNDVKKFYSLRSKTVHGAKPKALQADHATAKRGLEICGEVLRQVVKSNKVPMPEDWELMGSTGEI